METKVPVHIAPNELEAEIIKGLLKAYDIEAKIVPKNSNKVSGSAGAAPFSNEPYDIYVESIHAEEATRIIHETKAL